MTDGECRCTNHDYLSGCMVCGGELFCTPDKPLRAKCHFCGREDITHIFCPEGHYVCDDCHSGGILGLVEQICVTSDLSDPAALAIRIFELPGLHMHGPEYHSIVPAVLVAAYGSASGGKETDAIREAIDRGKAVPGGVCGTHGACGAGIGAGIAYSIIHKVTPYSCTDRGTANLMTALALTAISRHGGPRCCKRDAMTAIETAREHFGCFPEPGGARYVCSQFPDNTMCIYGKCPYFPAAGGRGEYL